MRKINNDLFEFGTKRRIYQYILKHQGLHLRELSREINIPKTTLNYHLNSLKKRNLISVKEIEHYSRYYVNDSMGVKDKQYMNIIRKKVPCRILLILSIKNYTLAEIVNYEKRWPKMLGGIGFSINKHSTTVSYHLDKLVKMGIVESWKEENKTMYGLKEPMDFFDFLIKYEGSFLDKVVSPFMIWIDRYSITFAVNKCIENLYDIFPHPYHV